MTRDVCLRLLQSVTCSSYEDSLVLVLDSTKKIFRGFVLAKTRAYNLI